MPSEPTLPIKNVSKADLRIEIGGAVTWIGANQEKEFTKVQLQSPAFTHALETGQVTLGKTDSLNDEQKELAKSVLSALVRSVARSISSSRQRFDQLHGDWKNLRRSFYDKDVPALRTRANNARDWAEDVRRRGKDLADRWSGWKAAAEAFVLDDRPVLESVTKAEAAVVKWQSEIDDLKSKPIESPEAREDWFKKRQDVEEKLKAAKQELKKAKALASKGDSLAALAADITTATTDAEFLKTAKVEEKEILEVKSS